MPAATMSTAGWQRSLHWTASCRLKLLERRFLASGTPLHGWTARPPLVQYQSAARKLGHGMAARFVAKRERRGPRLQLFITLVGRV
jgi:hypothetical protein